MGKHRFQLGLQIGQLITSSTSDVVCRRNFELLLVRPVG